MNGLIKYKSNAEIDAADNPPHPGASEFSVPEAPLAGHIRTIWGRHKIYRQAIDERLLACLRARRAVYSQAEAQAQSADGSGGLNMIFTDLTETKCRAGSAWIRDIVMPDGQRAWGLEPTPIPDLPEPIEAALKKQAAMQARQMMNEQADAGQPVISKEEFMLKASDVFGAMRDQLVKEYEKRAKVASDRMTQRIEDLMDEGGFNEAMDNFIEDFVTYPAAILKGPVWEQRKELTWGPGFKPVVKMVTRPTWARVSPFDFYPAPNSITPQRGDMIERMRLTRRELHEYKGIPGFDSEAIDKALIEYQAGRIDNWLWTESERTRLEQLTLYQWLTPSGLIDALQYWGSVPGWMLLDWGVDPDDIGDVTEEYEVQCILVGQYVIYTAVNSHPLGLRPYWAASYDTIPGAFWGRTIPDLAAVSQKMCNAAASAMADNLSIASGPMGWVHVNRLADGTQDLGMAPWKIFQLKESEFSTSGANPGIGFFQPQSNVAELQSFHDAWEMKSDDATGIPRYSYGNERATGAAATLGGLQTLMEAAGKGLRRATGAIDLRVMRGTLYMTWLNEMMYGEDIAAKGDCAVVPRGSSALLIKAAAAQNRQLALNATANPIDMQILGIPGRAKLLREALKALDLPEDIVPDDAALEQMMAEQAKQPSPAEIEAQGTLAEIQANNGTKERIEGARIALDLAKTRGQQTAENARERAREVVG